MMARGASTEIDAAYSNPAGLAWGHEGWQISFNVQKPFQYRNIEATLAQPYAAAVGFESHKFKGKASANPFVPALFASYKHKNWAIGFMAGIVGSGGKVKYNEGVPMFVVPVRAMMANNGFAPNAYNLDSYMEGKQYIYGVQANFTYKFNEHWSASAGIRTNIYNGYNKGHVVASIPTPAGNVEAMNMQIDVDQKGVGFCPILGLNYKLDRLTVAARYEFRSKLNIPNDTKTLSVSPAAIAAQVGPMAAPYQDGVKNRYDMPGLLSLAVGYEFIPGKFRGTLEYHWFDDKRAKMAGDRQDELKYGTQEVLVGLEYDVNKVVTVSAGAQRTDYGLKDSYQSNTSFACDSYSVGFGAAFNIVKGLRLNVGYFCSIYKDYTREASYMNVPMTETYSRTNHVFGAGIDYKF
ncbi:MAG: outer membrane beta-barrel protein [Bacteroidaceae bacterium]|nr:outer membrane beta-barrel protein [Bacteroidaceae bacterium]